MIGQSWLQFGVDFQAVLKIQVELIEFNSIHNVNMEKLKYFVKNPDTENWEKTHLFWKVMRKFSCVKQIQCPLK